MKLSMETFAIRQKFGDFKALDMIKEAGFDAVDFSYYWADEKSEVLGNNYREYAKKLKASLDELGLECNQAHADFSFRYGGEFSEADKGYQKVVRSIESAAILGAENIIVHAITIPEDEINVDFEEYNLSYYKSLEPYCEKFGIKVAVENLFTGDSRCNCVRGILATPKILCEFIEKLDSSCFVACIDLGHAAITGTKPENFILGMKKGVLKSLHVQDTDFSDDKHTVPYLGGINWDNVIKALKTVQYDGELTFEIFNYILAIPNELTMSALKFSHDVGRHLIKMYNN